MTQIQNVQPPVPQKGWRARLGKYQNNVRATTARLRESIPTEGPLAIAWEATLQLFRFLFNLLEVFFLAPLYGVYKVISRIPFVRAMGRLIKRLFWSVCQQLRRLAAWSRRQILRFRDFSIRVVKRMSAALQAGFKRFELTNLSHFQFFKGTDAELNTDYRLFSLNSQALLSWQELGAVAATLYIEDDAENMAELLAADLAFNIGPILCRGIGLPGVFRPSASQCNARSH